MADLTTTPVATQIQPPKGMSLAEMVNLAGGIQAYQQSQQLNPLQLQEAQLKVNQAQAMNPLLRQGAEQELLQKQAQARMEQLKLTGSLRQSALEAAGSTISHPDVIAATTLPANAPLPVIKKTQDALIKVIDKEIIPRLEAEGLSPAEIAHQRIGLSQQALANPQGFQAWLQRGTQIAGGPQTLVEQNLPRSATTSGGQAGTAILSTGNIEPMQARPNVNPPKADVELGAEYNKSLQGRVQASNDWLQRSAEMKPLLQSFKAGAGAATYAGLAQKLQALGAPDDLINKVANGDLSATQSFQKFMAGSIISAARQSAEGSPFASEVKNFEANNPSVNSDPKTLQRFIDFYDRLAGVSLKENEAQAQAKEKGIYNPGTWQADWQRIGQKQNLIPATPNAKVPTTETKQESQSFKEGQTGTYNGKKVIFKNGQWGYQ